MNGKQKDRENEREICKVMQAENTYSIMFKKVKKREKSLPDTIRNTYYDIPLKKEATDQNRKKRERAKGGTKTKDLEGNEALILRITTIPFEKGYNRELMTR